ncbi:HAMP domain-containing sensor histidine kinase [Parapedobacter lycopersici]|uniref:sensor histidine kinase n=1 Tax=Parapedobacter lycopersici TaxID=1864939 RepID=UPI003341BDF3
MINRWINKWIDFLRDHTYIITLLISVSLIGLLFVQFSLVSLEIDLQQRAFDKEIDEVLHDMHNYIEDDSLLSGQLIRLMANAIPDTVERREVADSVISEVKKFTDSLLLANNMSYLDYDVGFYQRYEDTIVISSQLFPHQPDYQRYSARAGWRIKEALGKGMFRFGLLFHNKFLFVIFQVYSILIIIAFFLLILVGSFFSTLLLLKRQKQLAQLKNDFINNLTHELKTPIFASSVIFKIINEKMGQFSNDELSYHLKLLEKENNQLKNKVDKVLELTVLESETPKLDLRALDVHAAIRQKSAMYQVLVEEKGGRISYDLQAKRTIIMGDTMHIGNILDNLLDNAIKYSDKQLDVRISTVNVDDTLVLKISDRGMGIGNNELNAVFEKFYRVSHGNLHQTKGFGLGLSYVKSVADLHNGKITLESRPGAGSIFMITLPLHHQ